ncbi:hypothetical protein [Streptomyces tritici]|uniref:hypothetical protein n=1 Tax=Streptomyces tritici TaxID=2054410 RepID=UPI003AF197B9
MNSEVCGTTRHVALGDASEKAGVRQKVTWSRVLRGGGVGLVIMLTPALLLGFFLSWKIGVAIVALTATAATAASLVFSFRGHRPACSAKKGLVLASRWWAQV